MFTQREPYATPEELAEEGVHAPMPGDGDGDEAATVAGSGATLVPRDPEIPPQPGEKPESADKIELFSGGPVTTADAIQGEAIRRRHSVLVTSLEEEGERQKEERIQAQIDDDYYHHQQWRPEEARVLMERGQAPLVFNEARGAIDWMTGTERRLRKDYRIRPRSPEDEQMAEVKTKAFKYVDDVNYGPWHRSFAFKQMATSGLGWLEEGINTDPEHELIFAGSEDWRRIYRDSRARQFDLTDCRYIIRRKILDLDYAIALLPTAARHLSQIAGRWGTEDDEADDVWYLGQKLTSAHAAALELGQDGIFGDNYTLRRAGSSAWDHGRRNSVEVLEFWYRIPEAVKVFTGGPFFRKVVNPAHPGHAQAMQDGYNTYEAVKMRMRCMVGTKYQPIWDGPSPFSHGRFPLVPMWGYRRGRDGMVYGAMRGMRDPQDDLNKRRSKALWALSVNRLTIKKDSVDDVEELREEAARADGVLVVSDLNNLRAEKFLGEVQGNMELAQADAEAIRNAGGVTGENLGHDTRAQSGKAIIAKQEQGSMATYELFDYYFLAFKMAGQLRLANIEQFCNQEWQFRIDPQGGKPAEWVTVNKWDAVSGTWKDDITASNADFIVDQQDYRATLSQAAMDSMFELLTNMAQFAPQVVLNLLDLVVDSSDVKGKDVWVARIRQMTGQRDPAKPPTPQEQAADQEKLAKQTRLEEISVETAQAQLDVLRSKITDTNAASVLKNLQALLAGVETVATVAALPGLAGPADTLAKSAGFVDQTPADGINTAAPAAPAAVAPALPAPEEAATVAAPFAQPEPPEGGAPAA